MFNNAGKKQIELDASAIAGIIGGWINLFNAEGKKQVELGASKIVGGWINLFNQEGKFGIHLDARGDGGVVAIYNPQEVPVMTMEQDSFVPQKDVWWALYLTAYYNGKCGLTEKLQQESFTVMPSTVDGLKLAAFVGTTCQPFWDFYLGQGRFSASDREVRVAYEEAGNYVFEKRIQLAFPQVSKNEVKITFFIQGYEVGTWRNGVMKLKGE